MVEILEYDPGWPEDFQREKQLLLRKLENYRVIAIEHIGSTAIPGLVSKPVIDIMVAVKNLESVDQRMIDEICSLGYEYRIDLKEDMPFRSFFCRNDDEGNRTHQIHVVPYMCSFWNRLILFRDYLRMHPDLMEKYGHLKKLLAKKHAKKRDYTKAKSDFINSVIAEAIAC